MYVLAFQAQRSECRERDKAEAATFNEGRPRAAVVRESVSMCLAHAPAGLSRVSQNGSVVMEETCMKRNRCLQCACERRTESNAGTSAYSSRMCSIQPLIAGVRACDVQRSVEMAGKLEVWYASAGPALSI